MSACYLMPQTGQVFRGYTVQRALGSGAFGVVYRATQGRDEIATKISMDAREAKNEIQCMQHLNDAGISPKILFEEHIGSMVIIGMDLTGPNLAYLCSNTATGAFELQTMQKVAFKMIECIETLHTYKIIHRDVKMSNFVVTKPKHPNTEVTLQIIDFGLSLQYKDKNGNLLEDTSGKDFSKLRHCSASVAMGQAPTPKDDIIQSSYAMLCGSGMTVQSIFQKAPTDLLGWKKNLLRNPSSTVISKCDWLVPFLNTIAEQDDHLLEYDKLKELVRGSDSEPEGLLHLKHMDGKTQLQ